MTKVFLISDNHFGAYDGPRSVIEIFKRPFSNSAEMNSAMIRNWNAVVKDDNTVFSLGDFAWLRDEMVEYANKLQGNKCFILGNHDFEGNRKWLKEKKFDNAVFPLMNVLTYKNKDFLLVHDPDDIPYWWRGWTIHGHVHRNPDYPFINGERRNINVSCEVIDYTPVNLDWILSHDIDTIRRMDDIKTKPVRW